MSPLASDVASVGRISDRYVTSQWSQLVNGRTFGSLVQRGRDAEDEVTADVRHWHLDDALAVLQTAVTLKGFPAARPTGVSSR